MRTPLTPHSSESEGFAQSLRSFTGSLSARCGGPCKNPSLSVGFAALRAPHPFPLAAWALARIPPSPGFRRARGAPTSLPACGGALQSNDYQGVTRPEVAISFLSNPFRKRAFVGAGQKRNQHRLCDADSLIIIALRRGRDSNPRSLSAQQFSRLP